VDNKTYTIDEVNNFFDIFDKGEVFTIRQTSDICFKASSQMFKTNI
jgi:hypothetical protein